MDLLDGVNLFGNEFLPYAIIIILIYYFIKFINFISALDVEKSLEDYENKIFRIIISEISLFALPLILTITLYESFIQFNIYVLAVFTIILLIFYISFKILTLISYFKKSIFKCNSEGFFERYKKVNEQSRVLTYYLALILNELGLLFGFNYLISNTTTNKANWSIEYINDFRLHPKDIIAVLTIYIILYMLFRFIISSDLKYHREELKKTYMVTIITKNENESFKDYFLLKSSRKHLLISRDNSISTKDEIICIDKREIYCIKLKLYKGDIEQTTS
jgi:hypothetical protein